MRYLFIFFIFCSCSPKKHVVPHPPKPSCAKYYDKDLKMNVYTSAHEISLYPTGELDFILFFHKNFRGQEQELTQMTMTPSFVVDTTGAIIDLRIFGKKVKDYSPTDLETLRVLRLMPKWKSAKCKGKKVPFLVKLRLGVY